MNYTVDNSIFLVAIFSMAYCQEKVRFSKNRKTLLFLFRFILNKMFGVS